jgi:hypothetical protein
MASRTRKKQITALFNDVIANTKQQLGEIKKIDDPEKRLAKYNAVSRTLEGFYDWGKPRFMSREGLFMGGFTGMVLGIMAGALICSAVVAAPAVSSIILAFMGAGVVSGATIFGGLFGLLEGKWERQSLRSKYGSIRNARKIYRLQEKVGKKAEKDFETVRALKDMALLREKFEKTYKTAETVPPAPPAAPAAQQRGPAV